MTWADDMAAMSLRAAQSQGEPVQIREAESVTEWAMVYNEQSYEPGELASPIIESDDSERVRLFARQYAGMRADLMSRRVMRTKWEPVGGEDG